jgi:uncharacterized protein YjbJ (UPF0337 family)
VVNAQILQGQWNEVKGKLRSKWGQLTSDELQQFNGNVDQLVGTIQRKTGEARESIERYLAELSDGLSSAVSQPAAMAREYPLSSMLVVFGMGLGVGVLLSQALVGPLSQLMQPEPTMTERLGRQMFGYMNNVLPESISRQMSHLKA